jgi:hypothetical protein
MTRYLTYVTVVYVNNPSMSIILQISDILAILR